MRRQLLPQHLPYAGGDLPGVELGSAAGAFENQCPPRGELTLEDGFDTALVEATLTSEVRRLQGALCEFGRRLQGVSEDIPAGHDFSKLVTSTFGLLGFQLAYALGQVCDPSIFLDDGREYLRKAELSLNKFFREFRFDGRDYVCIAKVGPCSHESDSAIEAGDERG